MRSAFLESPEDIQWLKDTHLRGVPLPSAYHNFSFAILQGNEDAPHAVNLYADAEPRFDADFLRVTFDHNAPTYCEYCEYDGKTDKPKCASAQR